MGMSLSERDELERWIEIIWDQAREFGLDPYPTHFEVVPQHVIYELGAYGLPARFSHWTFGRDYHRQKTSYEYGMSKIYEIVFNTDPCQAFLVEDNSMLSHKFVAAHVLGHCHFFKHNSYFQHTNRRMIEQMRVHAERIAEYEKQFGWREVENFLDTVMTVEMHFDPSAPLVKRKSAEQHEDDRLREGQPMNTDYDDIWNVAGRPDRPKPRARKFPEEPERDLMRFLMEYGRDLEEWQRDIIEIVRSEMLYFLPQMRTKIMNEGFASYWHEKILESLDLTSEEHWEFRRLHSSVLSPSGSRAQINPYYVGFQILKDIERRWDGVMEVGDDEETDWMGRTIARPTGEGRAKLFSVCEEDNDVTFLRRYLTDSLVKKLDLYTYKLQEVDGEKMWVVQDTDWRRVRDSMVDSMTNFGQPILTVEDGDYQRHGELYLKHAYDGKRLDLEYTERVLKNVHRLWGRPVYLESVADDKKIVLKCGDNGEITQEVA
ncbi:stage V sporulation protein R [Capsulimonas corticalis]|uniref:Stage V sporulation protein R n=2 Tax=Capsulimonas corticalis TaxID=2219043 RepID=A0A402D4P0_9BACT|nr:stage V sporulation protein R [Capsulimonas corticalis]